MYNNNIIEIVIGVNFLFVGYYWLGFNLSDSSRIIGPFVCLLVCLFACLFVCLIGTTAEQMLRANDQAWES